MEKNKSILITGASTGIGRACVLHLDKQGYKVFAGVRNLTDLDELRDLGTGNIRPLMLDVCKEEDIKGVFKVVSDEKECPLFGLVNNAGVGIGGIIEATPIEEFEKLFNVNFFGLHRVTRAMLPIIRENKGRIINVGSSSSYFSGAALGPYAASKFAVRAYTDALRMEMKTLGVSVSLVAPGAVESSIWDKAKIYKEKIRKNADPELLKVYEMFVRAGDKIIDNIHPIPAIEVAKAVLHGISANKPKYVYLVGKDAKIARFISGIPKRWSDYIFLKHLQKTAEG